MLFTCRSIPSSLSNVTPRFLAEVEDSIRCSPIVMVFVSIFASCCLDPSHKNWVLSEFSFSRFDFIHPSTQFLCSWALLSAAFLRTWALRSTLWTTTSSWQGYTSLRCRRNRRLHGSHHLSKVDSNRSRSTVINQHDTTEIRRATGFGVGPTPFHPVHIRCHLHCRITWCRSPLLCRRQPTLSPLPCHRPIDCRSQTGWVALKESCRSSVSADLTSSIPRLFQCTQPVWERQSIGRWQGNGDKVGCRRHRSGLRHQVMRQWRWHLMCTGWKGVGPTPNPVARRISVVSVLIDDRWTWPDCCRPWINDEIHASAGSSDTVRLV